MEDTLFENIEELDLEMFDFESGFEPVARSRSNTWPVPQPENYFDNNFATDTIPKIGSTEQIKMECSAPVSTSGKIIEGSSRKKKVPRKNPWGDVSYAELIAQAINSAQNRRLTLSQIYEWIVQNVPFFKDKSESKSSAGWKNSVRHNLSLHNRFIRIPNENQGKSSWWAINPDAMSGKSTRRRSASMEAGKLEKKRAMAKKRADSLKKKLLKNDCLTASNEYIGSDVQSSIAHRHLQGSFRPRASSCASSFGRLSSIPQEPDWVVNECQDPNWAVNECQEPDWTVSEYQDPDWAVNECQEPLIQQSIPPENQVFNNQECLPTNDQLFFTSQNLTETVNFCLLHPLESCNCNNPVEITSGITSSTVQENYVHVNDSYTVYTVQNNYNNATIPQSTLLNNKDGNGVNYINDVNYNTFTFIDQTNQGTAFSALPRNNSMLDDINEIIKKEQIAEIEKVNDSISTSLFISNNNNNNNYNLLNYQ